jgi:hypothetical protein
MPGYGLFLFFKDIHDNLYYIFNLLAYLKIMYIKF